MSKPFIASSPDKPIRVRQCVRIMSGQYDQQIGKVAWIGTLAGIRIADVTIDTKPIRTRLYIRVQDLKAV